MKGMRVFFATVVLVIVAFAPAIAANDFQIVYRQSDVTTDGVTRTGYVLLNVYNTSGEDVRDMEAWVEGDDSVTYDHHRIFIGDLKNDQQTEIMAPFIVSEEPVEPAPMATQAVWTLEYTNASGQRVSVNVSGLGVQ